MNENKTITTSRIGGTAEATVNIIPGETVDQFIPLAAKDLGLDEKGSYFLLGQNNIENRIKILIINYLIKKHKKN